MTDIQKNTCRTETCAAFDLYSEDGYSEFPVGTFNWNALPSRNLGGISTIPTLESQIPAQCINRRKAIVIYCLLALTFVCVSIGAQYYPNSIRGHVTMVLSVQNTALMWFSDFFLLENGSLGCNVILRSDTQITK